MRLNGKTLHQTLLTFDNSLKFDGFRVIALVHFLFSGHNITPNTKGYQSKR